MKIDIETLNVGSDLIEDFYLVALAAEDGQGFFLFSPHFTDAELGKKVAEEMAKQSAPFCAFALKRADAETMFNHTARTLPPGFTGKLCIVKMAVGKVTRMQVIKAGSARPN